jgi:hypothetical protein
VHGGQAAFGDEVEQGLGLGMKHRHSGVSSIEAQ